MELLFQKNDPKHRGVKMNDLNIALIEPEIPQNTGNISRTCAAIGAALHLVQPKGFTGLDYWDKLEIYYYENLEEFLQKNAGEAMYFFSTKAPRRHTDVAYPKKVFLVFGKETAGLPESLLQANPDTTVRIPMRENLRSLNLTNSAAIGIYEVLRQRDFEGLESMGHPRTFDWE